MNSMKTEVVTLLKYESVSIRATVYSAADTQKLNRSTILYLHGGGLIFGQRDDLPAPYIQKFIEDGHSFISIDYLLSPETKIDKIINVLKKSIFKINERYQVLDNLVLMGRSAGAYLCYLLLRDGIKAKGFISLYGYYQITLSEFTIPAPYYTHFPRVLPMSAQALIQSHPLVKGEMKNRYPIYVSGRQFGTWLGDFIPFSKTKDDFSLTDEDLGHLPPTILVHSKNDPDVPFKMSQKAAQLIPNAILISIDRDEHDFDRNVTNENLGYYDQIIELLDKRLV